MVEPALDRLTWRALTTDDVQALARLVAAVEAVDRTGEHYDESDFAEELSDPAVDPARDTLAAVGPDGELVAYAVVHGSATVRDVDRVWLDGAVHPRLRGRGLGRRLLERQERRGAEVHRERHPEVRASSSSGSTRRSPRGPRWSAPPATRRSAGGTTWSAI